VLIVFVYNEYIGKKSEWGSCPQLAVESRKYSGVGQQR
jgi:hypothetical protein